MRTGDVRGGLSDAPLLALEVRGGAEALWRLEPPGNPPLAASGSRPAFPGIGVCGAEREVSG